MMMRMNKFIRPDFSGSEYSSSTKPSTFELLKVEQNNLFEKLITFFTFAEDKLCPQLDLGVKLM